MVDKTALIVGWLVMLQHTQFIAAQLILWSLGSIEVATIFVSTRAYLDAARFQASGSLADGDVQQRQLSQTAQLFEVLGTVVRTTVPAGGLVILVAALLLAGMTLQGKMRTRVVFVNGPVDSLQCETLDFLEQAKRLGSQLILGVYDGPDLEQRVRNAQALPMVDVVIVRTPKIICADFLKVICTICLLVSLNCSCLEVHQIDVVAVQPGDPLLEAMPTYGCDRLPSTNSPKAIRHPNNNNGCDRLPYFEQLVVIPLSEHWLEEVDWDRVDPSDGVPVPMVNGIPASTGSYLKINAPGSPLKEQL